MDSQELLKSDFVTNNISSCLVLGCQVVHQGSDKDQHVHQEKTNEVSTLIFMRGSEGSFLLGFLHRGVARVMGCQKKFCALSLKLGCSEGMKWGR